MAKPEPGSQVFTTSGADYGRDLEWACAHAGNPNIKPENAPSFGAYNMCLAATESPLKWVKTFADHQSRKAKLIEDDRTRVEDRRRQFGYLDLIEGEFRTTLDGIEKP